MLPSVKKGLSHSRRGVALIIVLAFVVLLTGLCLAFFSRVTTDRTIADSHANIAKADLLAQTALEIVVSDLKQEILDGSDVVGSIRYPKTPYDAVPKRLGVPEPENVLEDPLANLVRRSDRNVPATRASAVNSEADPARGFRHISRARWNSHYLLGRANPGDGTMDSTPAPEFQAPDWVYVNRQGPVVVGAMDSALMSPSPANQDFILGRYAYTVYDEGGLLNANVSGIPSTASALQVGKKSSPAFVDLRVVGLDNEQSDTLLGWRNFASVQPGGTFPSYTMDSGAADRFEQWVMNSTSGFTQVQPVVHNNRTDQAFASRQHLLQFGSSIGLSADVFQYLGTFSRDLDQPSYRPHPDRPRVKSSVTSNAGTWGYGNTSHNADNESDPSEDINPPLLNVYVKEEFLRSDGTTAKVGEPIVKSRFPLSRLGLILRTSVAQKSDDDPIYKHFGLYRTSPSEPWIYDHGDSQGINRLHEVADLNREADFFELLLAGVHAGSLGTSAKSGGSASKDSTDFRTTQHFKDVDHVLQVIELGANIIDQYDRDGYPTRIQVGGDSETEPKTVSGVEDLPYIWSMRGRPVILSMNTAQLMYQPMIWNSHDPDSNAPTSAPTTFRIRAETVDPAEPWSIRLDYHGGTRIFTDSGEENAPELEFDREASSYGPITYSFTDRNLFRQPTMIAEANIPDGVTSSGNNVNQMYADPDLELIGIVAMDYAMRLLKAKTVETDPDTYHNLNELRFFGPNSSPGVRFIHEYLDGAEWVEFDSFTGIENQSSHTLKHFNTTDNTESKVRKQLEDGRFIGRNGRKAPDSQGWWGMVRTDPRTTRWSTFTWQYAQRIQVIDAAQNIYSTIRDGTEVPMSAHHGTFSNAFVPTYVHYNQDLRAGPPFAYTAENNALDTRQDEDYEKDELRRYYRDPDGIVRRAMGGYATDTAQGGSFDNIDGLPYARGNFRSRPLILNRPFLSVAELGLVFTGTPWKNLSMAYPESGNVALLDLFCTHELSGETMRAGRVNLNSRQVPVLQALFAGALLEPANQIDTISSDAARQLAEKLVQYTTYHEAAERKGPLTQLPDVVGRYQPDSSISLDAEPRPSFYFSGFSEEIGTIEEFTGKKEAFISRKREAAIRALVETGSVRTWNLLIDVVAQAGRFARNARDMRDFNVDGEKRYWLHVSIDRSTGQVIDQELEPVLD